MKIIGYIPYCIDDKAHFGVNSRSWKGLWPAWFEVRKGVLKKKLRYNAAGFVFEITPVFVRQLRKEAPR